jgi:hypothetical protein
MALMPRIVTRRTPEQSEGGRWRRRIGCTLYAALLLLCKTAGAAGLNDCSAAATEQAKKLLAFHIGPGSPIEIDSSVKTLPMIRNPANTKQRFEVLQVWGYVHRGQYRMRFIYARIEKDCVLMGQEILEYASL